MAKSVPAKIARSVLLSTEPVSVPPDSPGKNASTLVPRAASGRIAPRNATVRMERRVHRKWDSVNARQAGRDSNATGRAATTLLVHCALESVFARMALRVIQ